MTRVTQKDSENPVPPDLLADSIVEIANAMFKLKQTGVNRKCIIDLVHLNTKLSRKVIKQVFDSIEELENMYVPDDT